MGPFYALPIISQEGCLKQNKTKKTGFHLQPLLNCDLGFLGVLWNTVMSNILASFLYLNFSLVPECFPNIKMSNEIPFLQTNMKPKKANLYLFFLPPLLPSPTFQIKKIVCTLFVYIFTPCPSLAPSFTLGLRLTLQSRLVTFELSVGVIPPQFSSS